MGQRTTGTPLGIARATRANMRLRAIQTVRQAGRSGSFRRRWFEPIVIVVVDGGDAWSTYLKRMTSRPGWTVVRLARESGISRSSLFKWMSDGAGAITIESVYRIADALGDDRATALKAAGDLPPERDLEVDLILSSDRPEREKAAMIDRLMRRREEDRQRRIDDLKFVLGDDEGPAAEATA